LSALLKNADLISVEDYFAGEQLSDIRHEYIDGQVYAMGGASARHGLIASALTYALLPSTRRKGCKLFASDMKVHLDFNGKQVFYYPDLLLSCDPDDRETYFRTRPCLIIEILSESTERIDRREKFLAYQTLPSLLEYVLIAQDMPRVEIYRQMQAWQAEIITEGAFHLDCLALNLSMDDVYADVDFPPPVYTPRW